MTRGYIIILLLLGLGTAASAVFFFSPQSTISDFNYQIPTYSSPGLTRAGVLAEKKIQHFTTPEPLRAVYMTSCVAGTPSLRERVVKLVEETEINAIVVDLKDYTGTLSFTPQTEDLKQYAQASNCPIADLKAFVENLHQKNIYVIGRVTVFQDPAFAKNNPDIAVHRASDINILWADKKGINYLDPGAKKAWDHVVSIALDAYGQGVDELNFDYIRFPSDGNMRDISFPVSLDRSKPEVLEEFFAYLNKKLKPSGMIISADLFGMTTSSYVDVGIGQIWERTIPHFDYVAPMVYPSHYYNGFAGFDNPNNNPYGVIKSALAPAIARTTATTTTVLTLSGKAVASTSPQLYTKKSFAKNKVRPWLQDFDYPVAYTPEMVKAQIQATYDLGLTSWMMWDPSNRYTREVYSTE
ncbi:MAG: putative glycoside hydrolase [Patescibacteria group bacterium]